MICVIEPASLFRPHIVHGRSFKARRAFLLCLRICASSSIAATTSKDLLLDEVLHERADTESLGFTGPEAEKQIAKMKSRESATRSQVQQRGVNRLLRPRLRVGVSPRALRSRRVVSFSSSPVFLESRLVTKIVGHMPDRGVARWPGGLRSRSRNEKCWRFLAGLNERLRKAQPLDKNLWIRLAVRS